MYFVGGGLKGTSLATNAAAASGATTLAFAATGGVQADDTDFLTCVSVGMTVTGTGIPAGTFVVGVTPTSVTLSQATTASIASGSSITFAPMVIRSSLSLTTNATSSSGATALQFSSTSGVSIGMGVVGSGVPAGTFVTSFSGTVANLSQALTAGVSSGAAISFVGLNNQNFNGIGIYAALDGVIKDNHLRAIGGYGIFIQPSFSGLLSVTDNIGAEISVGLGAGRFISVGGSLVAGQRLRLRGSYMFQPAGWPRAFDAFIYNAGNAAYTEYHEDNAVQNNVLGINAGTASAPTSVTPGSSPYTFVNPTPSAITVIVSGGTVSDISRSWSGAAAFSTGQTSGQFELKARESLVVTYSAAPTMSYVPRIGQ